MEELYISVGSFSLRTLLSQNLFRSVDFSKNRRLFTKIKRNVEIKIAGNEINNDATKQEIDSIIFRNYIMSRDRTKVYFM